MENAKKLPSKPIVLFFYFKDGDHERNNFTSMARTLLSQLLRQDRGILDYVFAKCCDSGETRWASDRLIKDLLLFALRNCDNTYIILDGLDECSSRAERKYIVGFFREEIESFDCENPDRLRCLFVSGYRPQ